MNPKTEPSTVDECASVTYPCNFCDFEGQTESEINNHKDKCEISTTDVDNVEKASGTNRIENVKLYKHTKLQNHEASHPKYNRLLTVLEN